MSFKCASKQRVVLAAIVLACSVRVAFGQQAQPTQPTQPTFPAPESASTCEDARKLAIQVDGALPTTDVARYELRAYQVCAAQLGADDPETVSAMNNLAVTYDDLDRFEEALALKLKVLAVRRTTLAEDDPALLRIMHSLALTYDNLVQFAKAVALKERLLALRVAKLGADHADTLEAMATLAISYGKNGQLDKALAIEKQVVALRQVKLGESHPETLIAMGNLAVTFDQLGLHDRALVLGQKTLSLKRQALGADHIETLTSIHNLAVTYTYLGQHANALAQNTNAYNLRRIKLGDDHLSTLSSMSSLAISYGHVGQFDKALSLKEQALKLLRAKLGDLRPETLRAMADLAKTYGDLGQIDKALAIEEQTFKLRTTALGVDHPETLDAMNNLAVTYSDLGKHDKAIALKEQTLRLSRTKLGEDHPDTMRAINNLAVSYTLNGQHSDALKYNEQALQLRRAKLGEDHPDTLSSMANLAITYGNLGDLERALALELKILALKRIKLGADHPDTIKSMKNLAITHWLLNQPGRALELVPQIQRGAEKLRGSDLSSDNKQSVFAKFSNDYQIYSAWYAKAGQPSAGFDLGDLSKARTLTDNIGAQVAIAALSLADRARLAQSQSRLATARKNADQLSEQNNPGTAALLAAQKDIENALSENLQLQDDLKSKNPKYAQLTDLRPTTFVGAKDLLTNGETFISYLVQSSGEAQAYILDRHAQPKWVDLGNMTNLSLTVAAYRELSITQGTTPFAVDGEVRAAARALNVGSKLLALKEGGYQWLLRGQVEPQGAIIAADTPAAALLVLNKYWFAKLIKPVLPFAGNYARWIISPDKDLALLPFDTLVEEFNVQGDVSKIIAQNRNVTIVQSFAVYALLKQREAEYANLRRPKELMAMGNPVYADGWSNPQTGSQGDIPRDEGTRSFQSNEQTSEASNVALKPAAEQYALTRGTWKNLPGTAREVIAVAKSFGASDKGSATVDVFTGTDASEQKMQSMQAQGKLKDYKYLLFSAHGYLAQNPSLSALVLTQKGNPEGIDGYITAAKWPLYDIRSDLTVLSACDTGVGKTQAGEGVMGLPYALFIAGNKNTLLSLWPVDDDATAEFMSRFFAKLKAGRVQPEALSQTKREFMQHAKWNAPKYWAAFVLYGV